MSESVTKQSYRCTECGEEVHVEQWENAGLVLVCECGEWQSVKTNSTLPERWSQ